MAVIFESNDVDAEFSRIAAKLKLVAEKGVIGTGNEERSLSVHLTVFPRRQTA